MRFSATSTPRTPHPSIRLCTLHSHRGFRFQYGDYNPLTNDSAVPPYVQMLSTTNTSTMWTEFATERAETLSQLPPTVDPQTFKNWLDSTQGNSSGAVAASLF